MASQSVRAAVKQVKPILSVDRAEARKRVLNLYKAWYRQLPYIGSTTAFQQMLNLTFYIIVSSTRVRYYKICAPAAPETKGRIYETSRV